MVFSSTIFLFFFLPITLAGYYLINPKFKNTFLLLVSVFFYGWGEPKFIFVMMFSIFVNYLFGLLVDKYRQSTRVAKILISLMVIFNVSIFFIYKYLNFAISNINIIIGNKIPQTNILLPIGISFFTFQAMSYVLDVYKNRGKVQKNPLNVALYIMLFPQLIAGPIVRYETVSNAINNRVETLYDFSEGVKRFIVGLSKKIILSNSVAIIADKAFGFTDFSQLDISLAWLGAVAYSLQIYFDFSGYSDMAIGLGKMFGFHFDENFNYPYISRSVSEFWRRWHISLSSWFRDYVYFPLGGSKVDSKSRLIFNLFVVWSLTGIWHGASWNFIVWGLYYFILLIFEKLSDIPRRLNSKVIVLLYRILTLLCIIIGWVIFRANNLTYAIGYLKSMLGISGNQLTSNLFIFLCRENGIVLLISIIFCIPISLKLKTICDTYVLANKISFVISPLLYIALFVVSLAYTITSTYNPFIYFNF
ncbi:Peptidoglycan O-acetyltransferase [bioreactor metagenome]|uniref:Peptidoglycan O-acetyltransferase n=1 Tax=bioreactor metagenome TaxID=1076179 RepID=A0A644VV51_9ZZZZ